MYAPKLLITAGLFLLSCLPFNGQRTITLEEALTIAMENSPQIIQSRMNMEQNREYLNAQLAQLKSHFSLTVKPIEYSVSNTYEEYFSQWYKSERLTSNGSLMITQPIKLTDGTLVLRNDFEYLNNTSEGGSGSVPGSGSNSPSYRGYNNNLYLSYTQPLFTYNRTKMNLKRNQLNLENATLSYSIQMLTMERNVAQAFYAIYQKQMAVQIAREEFENQTIGLEIIRSKVEGGLSAREELLQGELNYATSQLNLDNALVDLDNSMDQFKQLIGLPLDEEINISTDIEYKPVLVDVNKAIENGIHQRLELSQRKIDLNNAEFDLIETSANNKFKGDVNLSFGLMGNDEVFTRIYDKPTRSPKVGVTFTIPVFDWGERKARMKAASIEVESRKIDLVELEKDIVINIRMVYRNLQNLTTQIAIARQNEKNAQLTYEINLERYKNGDLTSIDLERYQNQLSEKKIDLSNALINYRLELLNLKIQSLWDFENNTSFVPLEFQNNLQYSDVQ